MTKTHTPQALSPLLAPPSHWTLERIFTLYIDPELTIADIAFTINKSIIETLALLKQPDFLALAAEYAEINDARAAYHARCGIDIATRTYARLADRMDLPETARKSAAAIVKLSRATDCCSERSVRPSPMGATATPIGCHGLSAQRQAVRSRDKRQTSKHSDPRPSLHDLRERIIAAGLKPRHAEPKVKRCTTFAPSVRKAGHLPRRPPLAGEMAN